MGRINGNVFGSLALQAGGARGCCLLRDVCAQVCAGKERDLRSSAGIFGPRLVVEKRAGLNRDLIEFNNLYLAQKEQAKPSAQPIKARSCC